jgi:acetyl-CoA carboxylase biotin carboxyl carrier protein
MDFKQIKELITLVNESQIGEVLIENDNLSIRIRHLEYNKKNIIAAPAATIAATTIAPVADHAKPAISTEQAATKENSPKETLSDKNLITVKSPMIGTFYRSSSPDKAAYAKVGDDVQKGDVLCIIEAMKLFNEIESESSGKIVKILVENESPVEYDQPLFLIDPAG